MSREKRVVMTFNHGSSLTIHIFVISDVPQEHGNSYASAGASEDENSARMGGVWSRPRRLFTHGLPTSAYVKFKDEARRFCRLSESYYTMATSIQHPVMS